jgi:hypothetical protein
MLPDRHPIDDRSAPAPAPWRLVSDEVMGGLSTGTLTATDYLGRPALALRGRVRLENQGGFLQMALALTPPPGEWRALELELAGPPHDYGVHLRTAGLAAPWQAWRATVAVTPAWQTLRVPFDAFRPYRFEGTLVPSQIRRLGLVALGSAFDAELYFARAAWAR